MLAGISHTMRDTLRLSLTFAKVISQPTGAVCARIVLALSVSTQTPISRISFESCTIMITATLFPLKGTKLLMGLKNEEVLAKLSVFIHSLSPTLTKNKRKKTKNTAFIS